MDAGRPDAPREGGSFGGGAGEAAGVEERLIKFAGADADLAGVVAARLDGKGPQSKLDEAEGGGVPFDLSCTAPACVRKDCVRNPREPDVANDDEGGELATGVANEMDGAAFRFREGKTGGGAAAAELNGAVAGSGFDPPRSKPKGGFGPASEGVAGDVGNTVSTFDKDLPMNGSSTGARGGEKCLGRGSRSPVMGPCENAS